MTTTGSFVVQLGNDTVGVERYVRTPSRLEVDELLRSPQVLRRRSVYVFEDHGIASVSMTISAPGDSQPLQTIEGTMDGDSLRLRTRTGLAAAQASSQFVPRGSMIIRSPIPWSLYEMQASRLLRAGDDSLRTTMSFLGAPARWWLRLRRQDADSIEIANQHDDLFRARVDRDGRILGVRPISGTFKVSVQRVEGLDPDSTWAAFVAEDRAGGGIRTLSPRDTLRTVVDGASIWIDYSRPAKRGRLVFGGVVPFGEVWRTGANAATQMRTDLDLEFGDVLVPAGLYSLWTIPSPEGWTLILNAQSGQWGTRHDAEMDLFRIDLTVSELPEVAERFTIGVESGARGGTLHFDWDTTRASVPFRVSRRND